jgi:uncharacterized protein YycO
MKTQLIKGDICLSTTKTAISNAIKLATGSSVSHAFLYLGDGKIAESIGDGVVVRPLAAARAEYSLILGFRHPRMTPALADKVIRYAAEREGLRYDMRGVVGAKLPGLGDDPNSWYCSELVAAAFQAAGLPLAPTRHISPDDLKQLGIKGVLKPLGPVNV